MAGDLSRSGSIYGGVAEPCTVVLFGASGDLAKRKVIPAMYDLAVHNALGPRYAIVGFARTAMSEEAFRAGLGEAAKTISEVGPIDPKQWDAFASNLYYCPGDYANPESYAQLCKRLTELEAAKNLGGNRFQLGQALAERSEEHTSELQSRLHLVCRLLLEKKKNND